MFAHSQQPTQHVHISGVGALQRSQLNDLFQELEPSEVRCAQEKLALCKHLSKLSVRAVMLQGSCVRRKVCNLHASQSTVIRAFAIYEYSQVNLNEESPPAYYAVATFQTVSAAEAVVALLRGCPSALLGGRTPDLRFAVPRDAPKQQVMRSSV